MSTYDVIVVGAGNAALAAAVSAWNACLGMPAEPIASRALHLRSRVGPSVRPTEPQRI